MNQRMHGTPMNNSNPNVRDSELQLSITFQGKTYAICDSMQYKNLVTQEMEKAAFELASEQQDHYPDEDQIRKRAEAKVDDRGFATLDMILSRMTPQQREEWKQSYRFTPITRTTGM